jgi:hypothetical protein
LNVEFEKDSTPPWIIINRFLAAHVKCGYVAPTIREVNEPVRILDMPLLDLPFEE